MRYILTALLVVALPALLVLAVMAVRRPRRCPKCGRRALWCVNFIRATILVDGRRAPASWSYHLCRACGVALKLQGEHQSAVEDQEKHHLTSTA